MKTQIMLCIKLLVICIVTINCKKDNPVETPIDNTAHYYLQTIDGYTLENHKQVYGAPDYPLEFKFTKKDSIFRGSVIFERMGEKVIDSTRTNSTAFVIDINYRVVDALNVSFYTIKFANDTLKCRSWFSHPTIDYRSNIIIALKK